MYFPVLFIVSLISALTCGVLDTWQGTKDNYSEWVILYQETVAFHKREVYCHKRKWDQQSLIDLYKQLTVHESLQCLVTELSILHCHSLKHKLQTQSMLYIINKQWNEYVSERRSKCLYIFATVLTSVVKRNLCVKSCEKLV